MATFKVVINDTKTGKSYQKEITGTKANSLIGKRIGQEVDGVFVDLPGYKLLITGGTDKDGFPMRKNLQGARRKKLLLKGGIGFHPTRPGMRKKKMVRGNTISADIVQINMKIVQYGPKPIEEAIKEGEA
ncbi:30S ribosomal protein S6e [Candidatus Aciduliprofundum boonei]|uniref:Small ribosomal subunit protein eS6 n=1 Tax=Aciduliprofundum boonei (strain DSM 19572 / T469) TaxID=439481 RepID=B5IAM9_ACIB4|nr:30S ribosomal protein S6e [Candidatus Aciduliprofundum boonei]ADD08611.1 Ribosomal protein S6e [Aciduliprofundum boonei T469]EDY36186.1 ribosomal protein S6e [Aciduliprofundum boonei T469]EDY36869.1 ribosomal protein S6e [Aciduliprofundum boonei T469]HII54834.1 30S ribosomal protein S6e [Candidatus Aciduliprofundum boonei]